MSADPIETMVADALLAAGIEYERHNHAGLDFYLPYHGVHIEVKQFHTTRIAEQMSRAENVIVIQGKRAAILFSAWLHSHQPEHTE